MILKHSIYVEEGRRKVSECGVEDKDNIMAEIKKIKVGKNM